ncbi:hypothetical protein OX284_013010 [Flavobacterium sp. SUN046]|uniref:hypothetical protein n=1 Tax=Flavobacterium sp. SUN046 TaxID=3002440 RepID=UPI002DBD8270|nr:hypothetical protein [Flavobacterium sp. SUN046]MEC4050356.1 hypothetical protein [Flavobacterium sp. SUN046]
MTKSKLFFLIMISQILFNCTEKKDSKISLNGIYGMTKYFNSRNTKSEYLETFLLQIEKNKIKIFGTVQTWGKEYIYKLNKTKDTILLENNFKIFRKNKDNNVIYLETRIDNKTKRFEYQKNPYFKSLIDEKGINNIQLSKVLNKIMIVGKYKFNGKIIDFKENGKVENLDYFNKYTIKPRLGTNTYYDDKIIETENGMWKYEKKNDNLILTKYSSKRDEYEMYILGEPKIELEKITSH